jgi:hypothetical protein
MNNPASELDLSEHPTFHHGNLIMHLLQKVRCRIAFAHALTVNRALVPFVLCLFTIVASLVMATAQAATVTTLAGAGPAGSADGVGTVASFYGPRGVAVDAVGNVYVVDPGNGKIRKINAAGQVTTLAGSGLVGSADGIGTAASFFGPSGVAVDAAGIVYVADATNHKIRKISAAGVVTTLAGSGSAGSADGTGSAASFSEPKGVAVDAAGNVYVADTGSHTIRKISSAGEVTTLAGSSASGSIDGTGTAASFYLPSGVAVDIAGNVVVADYGNNMIRKISAAGVVTTLAGGVRGSTDGTGTAASFAGPWGVAVDAVGNVYVGDFGNRKIRKISAAGEVTTLAGSGGIGSVDGTGTAASFYSPKGVAVDAAGNVYVADGDGAGDFANKIRKITGDSVTSTAVTANPNPSSDGRIVTLTATVTGSAPNGLVQFYDAGASLGTAQPLASGRATVQTGSLTVGGHTITATYFADANNLGSTSGSVTLTVNTAVNQTYFVSTLAGSGLIGSADGTGTAASFYYPEGNAAVDAAGNVYVADSGNNKIRKISAAGVVTTLAGSGSAGSADGPGTTAQFSDPKGVAVDATGNVFVADAVNNKIRKISAAGVVTTLAGSGSADSADGTGTAASFRYPTGVAVDSAGNVYVADHDNHKIRKVSAAGEVTTLAGSGAAGWDDGTGTAASFNGPSSVAVDTAGNVYVADSWNRMIRKISAAGAVTTLAWAFDGGVTTARFSDPTGIAVDGAGTVYFADFNGNKVYQLTAAGVVTTVAGSGADGWTDGTGTAATFWAPTGVAVDGVGNLYVTDTANSKIRKITGGAVTSTVLTANPNPASGGQTVTLTATVTGSAPTGLMQFDDAGVLLGAAQPLAAGQATLQTSSLSAGSHSITASYLGDSYNASSQSSAVSVDVQAASAGQTITFSVIGNRNLGTAPFAPAVSASSGLPVTLTSQTQAVCTVSSNMVTLLAPGPCTLAADQPGNSAYAAAPQVRQSFSVLANTSIGTNVFISPADTVTGLSVASITFDTVTVGGQTTVTSRISAPVAPAFQASCTPPVTLEISTTAVYSGAATVCVDPVQFAVSCTAGAKLWHYSGGVWVELPVPANASAGQICGVTNSFSPFAVFSPTQVSQTIGFLPIPTQSLGSAPFTVSATASSGLAVTLTSLTSSVCRLSGNTVTLIATGTCTLRADQGGNTTYAAATPTVQSFNVVASGGSSGDVPLPPWAMGLLAAGLLFTMARYRQLAG